MATLSTVPPFWDQVEPHYFEQEGRAPQHPCYFKLLKADLLSGTCVLLATAHEGESGDVVARIVKTVESTSLPFSVQVNIFKNISKVGPREGILFPQGVNHNHLKHLPKVVQTTELRVVSMTEISNLALFSLKRHSMMCPTFSYLSRDGHHIPPEISIRSNR
jgi:hypothetical protein